MPFRERVRRVLGRSTTHSETNSVHQQESRKNSAGGSVYLPGEAMPKPKYRQPVDKKHKEHLESFNFMSGFGALARRKSQASQYSPMGSRMPSRNNSLSHPMAAKAPPGHNFISKVDENADDDTDPINGRFNSCTIHLWGNFPGLTHYTLVGASRRHSMISGPSRRHSREIRPSGLQTLVTADQSEVQSPQVSAQQMTPERLQPHRGFTDAEIAEALKKLQMKVGGKENAPPTPR